MLPLLSTATPEGLLIWALVAGPPSPLKPAVPLPATVAMFPGWIVTPATVIALDPVFTTRIRLLLESPM